MGQKVSYNSNKKSKFKIVKVAIILIIAIFVIYIFARAIKNVVEETNDDGSSSVVGTIYSIKDFTTLSDLLKEYECTYISDNLDSNDFLTVYLKFNRNLYTGDTSNETHFTNIVRAVAEYEDYKNFELIDNERDIDIVVTCEDEKIVEIEINGDINYYLNEDSKRNSTIEETAVTNGIEIESSEIQDLIENGWNPTNVDLGSKDSTVNNYDIYFDEGYKFKTVGREVYNFIFTTKYNGSIVNGLNASSTLSEVESVLGEPAFVEQTYIYGYLGKECYIFFDFENEQISIYPVQIISDEDIETLINLINEMNDSSDIKQFAMDLTSLWTDYDVYDYDSDYVDLQYTLKGFELRISSDSLKNGIFIYTNYSGNISEITSLDNVYAESSDLVFTEEAERMWIEAERGYGASQQENENSELYLVEFVERNSKNYILFLSTDTDARSDVELQTSSRSYVWISESEIIYGVANDGLYYFNVLSQTSQKLISGDDEEFEIISYENNVLKYDETEVTLEF